MPTRRDVLLGGLAAGAAPFVLRASPAYAAAPGPQTITLSGTATGIGTYNYHPFTVPAGVNRVTVSIAKQGDAKTGLGLFDERGAHYATLGNGNGFRGIYGEERGEFFVAADSASQSFIPGPIGAGTWTVIVPIFTAMTPTPYVITVTLTYGAQPAAFVLGPEVGVVLDRPGWYRGDLHAHTPESSDAFASRSAMTPAQWADACRRIGLDFLALTDHNVVSQNFDLGRDAGEDVLLMPGEEMTNWFHGHATVSGLTPGDWLDWRQRPAGAPIDPVHEQQIAAFIAAARATGAYISAAHPLAATLTWQFFPEAAADAGSRTDGIEVWTGPFQPDDEAAVRAWDQMLVSGQRIVANGGSDLHGVRNTEGFLAGTPTTVVAADRLAKADVIAALKRGRAFITRLPTGVEIYLTGTAPGGQRQIMGGTLYGTASTVAMVSVLVRQAAGMRLEVVRDGQVLLTLPITAAEQTFEVPAPIGAGGYLRAQVRGAAQVDPANPRAGRLDMEALTNPVFLALGEVPAGTQPDPTQPPAQPGPRRMTGPTPVVPEVPVAVLLPVAGAAVAGVAARRRRPAVLSLADFRIHAAAGTLPAPVRLTGQVVRANADLVVLGERVDGCCASSGLLTVELVGWPESLPAEGSSWTVRGTGSAPAASHRCDGPPQAETPAGLLQVIAVEPAAGAAT